MRLDIDMSMGIVLFCKFTHFRAYAYGNEVELGKALKECKTPRSEIFVTVRPNMDHKVECRPNYGALIILELPRDWMCPLTTLASNISIVRVSYTQLTSPSVSDALAHPAASHKGRHSFGAKWRSATPQ
jgi:hypothetical protein